MSRFKAFLGVKLAAREFGNQKVEALVKCRALSWMASLGLPGAPDVGENSSGLIRPDQGTGDNGCIVIEFFDNAK